MTSVAQRAKGGSLLLILGAVLSVLLGACLMAWLGHVCWAAVLTLHLSTWRVWAISNVSTARGLSWSWTVSTHELDCQHAQVHQPGTQLRRGLAWWLPSWLPQCLVDY